MRDLGCLSFSILMSENLKQLLFSFMFLFADSSLPPLYLLPFLPAPLPLIILHPPQVPSACMLHPLLPFLPKCTKPLEISGESWNECSQSLPTVAFHPPYRLGDEPNPAARVPVVPSGFHGAAALCGKQGVGMKVDRVSWDISPLLKRSYTHTYLNTGSHQRRVY